MIIYTEINKIQYRHVHYDKCKKYSTGKKKMFYNMFNKGHERFNILIREIGDNCFHYSSNIKLKNQSMSMIPVWCCINANNEHERHEDVEES